MLGHDLSRRHRIALEREADLGNGRAAFRLSVYYSEAHVNRTKRLYWLRVGAREGNPSAEYSLGFVLTKGGTQRQVQGVRWLRCAKLAGVALANELLGDMGLE